MNKRDRVASLVFCSFAVGSTLVPVAAGRGRVAAVSGAVAARGACRAVGVPGTLLPPEARPR